MYLPPEEKEKWQAEADAQKISLSAFIKQCVNKQIKQNKGRQ